MPNERTELKVDGKQNKKRVAATRSRKHTSATIRAVDDDGTGHAGCMLDLPSAHRSNLLNSSIHVVVFFFPFFSSSSSVNFCFLTVHNGPQQLKRPRKKKKSVLYIVEIV